ncbi:MAG: cytochrome c-type biogenesis protein CcmH [Chloroflexota bacterium]|jgi:cytochrome c-type biogenesis protein CcmH
MFQPVRIPKFLFVALATVLLLALALPVLAQEPSVPVSDDEVNAVAKQLYCPICESTPLDVCATQACADWREVIRTKLAEGQTAEDIKAYFELQYGPQALAEPPRSGFTQLVWILPVIAVVVGGFFFVRYIRSLQAGASSVVAAGPDAPAGSTAEDALAQEPPPQDDYRARIESELREK